MNYPSYKYVRGIFYDRDNVKLRMNMDSILYNFIKAYGTVALPWGYLCMLVARTGYASADDNFKKAFIILIFASITHYAHLGISYFCSISVYILYPIAMAFSLVLAFLWRRYVGYFIFNKMNKKGLTNENGEGTVLNSLMTNTSHHVNGATVYMKDGNVYQCSGLGWVLEEYKFGLNIDSTAIAMPVTHMMESNTTQWKDFTQNNQMTSELGVNYMYIPMREVKKCEFVLQKK